LLFQLFQKGFLVEVGFLNDLAELAAYNLNQGGFLNVVGIFATINRLTVARTLIMVMI